MEERARPSRRIRKSLRLLARDTRGATAIEYGLIVALVVLAIIGSVKAVATITINMWGNVSSAVVNSQ